VKGLGCRLQGSVFSFQGFGVQRCTVVFREVASGINVQELGDSGLRV